MRFLGDVRFKNLNQRLKLLRLLSEGVIKKHTHSLGKQFTDEAIRGVPIRKTPQRAWGRRQFSLFLAFRFYLARKIIDAAKDNAKIKGIVVPFQTLWNT